MPSPAPHFTTRTLTFFRQLEKNNDRQWFTPRKPVFEAECRQPMLDLVAWLNERLTKFAVEHVTEPKKAVYRIYRDTRFSKDKTPYKTHIGALFVRKGISRHGGANFYVGVSHKGVEVAGGMYMPEPDELTAVRSAIAADPKTAIKLFGDKKIVKLIGPLQGTQAARMVKGFDEDPSTPLGSLLRRKQFYHYVTLPADLATKPVLGKEIVRRFEVLMPVVNWVNDSILAAKPADDDDGRPKRPAPMF